MNFSRWVQGFGDYPKPIILIIKQKTMHINYADNLPYGFIDLDYYYEEEEEEDPDKLYELENNI